MGDMQPYRPTAADVLSRYNDEDLPDFCGIVLTDVNQSGLFDNFPLSVAATRGDIDDIRALLEGGAFVNAAGEHGCTALHDAVAQGNIAAVKILVEWGASLNLQDDFGDTPLDIARRRNSPELLAVMERAL